MKKMCEKKMSDYGPYPYAVNVERLAMENRNFRTAVWTGCHMQMTVMMIPMCGEIGLEVHPETDQFIRVEQGRAVVQMGECKERVEFQQNLCKGDAVFIPAGMWHNVLNTGRQPLRLSTIYAPSQHPRGTVHRTKADAEKKECER